MFSHAADDKIKLLLYVDAVGGGNPKGRPRQVNGTALSEEEQGMMTPVNEITFRKGNDFDSKIELKMRPEFRNGVRVQQTMYHNPQPYLKSAKSYSEETFAEWLAHENTTELLQTDIYEVHID